ncbi:hypothetical protein SAMN04515667_0036 [Formosa sp. Hel1_31_208]|uniref:hypothetical protein n=1 Tax=Formosa sp. Hel1_31_208 TaxID=1798225 RepID=UPI00087C5DD3|nr:hypothetical protein [Formosa sp. Hel1_31_208]SDR65651.1 hypothetical protein SAMN04515667_0036 [Formosa sp. Hel1_31_208]
MKNIWFICFCASLLLNCKNTRSNTAHPIAIVPENAEIILKINSAESLENGLRNNALIKGLMNYKEIKDFNLLLAPFYSINVHESYIAISETNKDSLDLSFIIPLSKNKYTLDSIPGLQIDFSFDKKNSIHKLTYNDNTYYSKFIDSIVFISNNIELAKNASKAKSVKPEFESFNTITNNEKMISVFINQNEQNHKFQFFKDSILQNSKFSDYMIFDSEISQNAILLNGITKSSDSTKSLINIFKNTIPQANKLAMVLPEDTEYFKSITFSNYDILRQNLINHHFQDSLTLNFDILETISEAGYTKKNNEEALVLRSIDPTITSGYLTDAPISNYRGVSVYALEDISFLKHFAPVLTIDKADLYITIDEFFIFSNDIDYLEHIITNYQNNTILSESNHFKSLNQNLSDEASLLIYTNSSALNDLINFNFNDDIKLDISRYKSSAIQFIYDTDFAHVNAALVTHKGNEKRHFVSEELNITLDAELIGAPQLVKNHKNDQMDIVAQDVNNNLYLISNEGKVFWKKQLDGHILGKIKQIDTYKNGRLQLVFNTSKRLYVIDRNGKDVNAFPLKFNDAITQPVSVFDYDNNKNYRLLITQDKSLLMYDKNGKGISGFNYKSAKNSISTQPKHFRIGRKDFIVFAEGNQLEILDRIGRTRIDVKERISFSNNDVFLYNNKFTTSNSNGELLEINQKGAIAHTNLNANSDHKITTTSKTLVVLNDNKLTIKSKTIELDFGEFTAPNIFYINDKIYVSVTDLQSNKGYLFDSQAKPIANFPVYANSELEIQNIDNDNALEVITKGEKDAIIIYKIH